VLREFIGNQPEDRRWFEDDYFDLILWTDSSRNIRSFQLSYAKPDSERPLTWDHTRGYAHFRVERGEAHGYRKPPNTLWPTDGYARAVVLSEFQERSFDLPASVRDFVTAAVRAAPASP
jgi:hypothetical protein